MLSTSQSFQRAASAVLVVLLCGCAGTAARSPTPSAGSPATVHVRIENNAFVDVRVHAVMNDANRVRLGSVGALSTRTIAVPAALSAARAVRLFAVPMAAGDTHQTEIVHVQPGDTLVWQLANESRVSRFFVRQ